ncbi:MAG: DNA polymerase III subunit gamma/tau [Coriobacteriales bacterium]|jgi:DNA polymerase-3 subunit gamma/tau
MASQSLYRKYRPQTFSDVVGQEHIEQTLRNALASDRISHAYLFCGPRGTGKTTTARLLAKALLCDKAPTANPDGVCENCKLIAEGEHPDVYELDAASRTGVDNVREEIIGRVAFSPTRGRYKVYIIDEVHMLSGAAFNALLKTLEEPPDHVVFVLCTTDPQKVPATIISRCQKFDFHRLTTEQICTCLEQICEGEGFTYEPEAIELIANQANGGMRDAITALEQVAVFGNGNVAYASAQNMFGDVDTYALSEVVDSIAARDVASCFAWVEQFSATGIDVAQVAHGLTSYIRDLYVVSLVHNRDALPGVSDEDFAKLESQARAFGSSDRLASVLMILGDLSTELRSSVDARLSLEIALTKMAHPKSDLTLESLAGRIDALEASMASGAGFATSVGAGTSVDYGNVSEPSSAGLVQEDAWVPVVVDEPFPNVPRDDEDNSGKALDHGAADASTAEAPRVSDEALSKMLGDPSTLRRMWDNVAHGLSRQHPIIPSLLGGSVPHGDIAGERILVELPQDATFAQQTLSDPEMRENFSKEIERVFGRKLSVEFTLGAPSIGGGGVAKPATSAKSEMRKPEQTAEPAAKSEMRKPEQTVEPVPSSETQQPEQAAEPAPNSGTQSPERDVEPTATSEKQSPEQTAEPAPKSETQMPEQAVSSSAAPEPMPEPAPEPNVASDSESDEDESDSLDEPDAEQEAFHEEVPLSAYDDFPSSEKDDDFYSKLAAKHENDEPAKQDENEEDDEPAPAKTIPMDSEVEEMFRDVFGDGVVFRDPGD